MLITYNYVTKERKQSAVNWTGCNMSKDTDLVITLHQHLL